MKKIRPIFGHEHGRNEEKSAGEASYATLTVTGERDTWEREGKRERKVAYPKWKLSKWEVS